jgi:hypothetical protein
MSRQGYLTRRVVLWLDYTHIPNQFKVLFVAWRSGKSLLALLRARLGGRLQAPAACQALEARRQVRQAALTRHLRVALGVDR